MGVSVYQIYYIHSAHGGRSYGLTYPSEPVLFSKPWWELVGWFMNEAKQRGAAVGLSDYTLGIGQGYKVDEILRDQPVSSREMCQHLDVFPLPNHCIRGRSASHAQNSRGVTALRLCATLERCAGTLKRTMR